MTVVSMSHISLARVVRSPILGFVGCTRRRGRRQPYLRTSSAWSTFVRNHARSVLATDFFVVVTASFRVLYVFVVLEVGSRRILHWNVTEHPTAEWTAQQRSEEHTSELQSLRHLVCRLLLEKKN